jgi:radical SAM protein with 4Fe4S-binding SPASM domain
VVVWNATRACNLRCLHCYLDAERQGRQPDEGRASEEELTTGEAKRMLDDLARFGVPVILFSGGEPLLRPDLMELGEYAIERGLRAVISTNGTLLNPALAKRIKEAGFSYVGVSLDGTEETNDRFRGERGAFAAALRGIRNCREAGLRTGLRLTLNRRNFTDLPAIFDLLVEERLPRACFYHLVYAGRGAKLREEDLTHEQSREAIELIFERARAYHRGKVDLEVLTVDNHADGVYLYQTVGREDPARANEVGELLRWNGGNSSGVGIGAVGPRGEVHADQFWQHYSFGNVRRRPFSEIWRDTSDEIMRGLKDRKPLLKGRCGACRHLDLCNGNLRVRAEAVYGDVWQQDPACYLTDREIGLGEPA